MQKKKRCYVVVVIVLSFLHHSSFPLHPSCLSCAIASRWSLAQFRWLARFMRDYSVTDSISGYFWLSGYFFQLRREARKRAGKPGKGVFIGCLPLSLFTGQRLLWHRIGERCKVCSCCWLKRVRVVLCLTVRLDFSGGSTSTPDFFKNNYTSET